jgi:hypothetical protein
MTSNVEALRRMRIVRMLAYYPSLKGIIRRDTNLFQLNRDQYNGDSDDDRKELTLGGILLTLSDVREFIEMMDNLNIWICNYPEYQTQSFGKKIKDNFFNFYSEIEVFHHLKEKGLTPKHNPQINAGSRKNLDFDIEIESHSYFIEVLTPRMSVALEELIEREGAGFYDPERGLGPRNEEPFSRVQTLIKEEIAKHIDLSTEHPDAPVILVINNTYARWEIPGVLNPFETLELPESICGILFYDRYGTSRFFVNPAYAMDAREQELFSTLM